MNVAYVRAGVEGLPNTKVSEGGGGGVGVWGMQRVDYTTTSGCCHNCVPLIPLVAPTPISDCVSAPHVVSDFSFSK